MGNGAGPLNGLRVTDFTWAAMGPYAGYLLAGLGAEVIQVSRPPSGKQSTTASITQFFDIGKICVKINVKEDEGRNILLKLISKSDIFLENFRPGVVENLGLDFETVRKGNPDVVMVSGSALGRSGSDSSYVGYAPIFSALSGLADATGFEDGNPVEIRYPSDITSGALMAFAAIAGIANRRNKSGSYVDLAARDALIWTLSSSFALSEEEQRSRLGNDHDVLFPHGVFRCAGEDQWVTIAIRDETQRKALYDLVGCTRSHKDGKSSLSPADRTAIEADIEKWTMQQAPEDAVRALQDQGIAAFPSMDARDLWEDTHLRAREAYQYEDGFGWVAGPPWVLEGGRPRMKTNPSDEAARVRVFVEILGMDQADVDACVSRGILG
jgi:benzylsuccinate CoA-transferase BbsF subunit